MSSTIEHDYQYKGLMYVSIAESIHFNNERVGNGMRIIALSDMGFIYIPSANKSELIHHTSLKRGTIGKAFNVFFVVVTVTHKSRCHFNS